MRKMEMVTLTVALEPQFFWHLFRLKSIFLVAIFGCLRKIEKTRRDVPAGYPTCLASFAQPQGAELFIQTSKRLKSSPLNFICMPSPGTASHGDNGWGTGG